MNEVNDLNKKVALCYKIPRLTVLITEDLKLVKKLNQILVKLERTNKEVYIHESINILQTLSNILDMNKFYLVLCEMLEPKFHETILLLYNKISNEDIIKYLQSKVIVEEETENL